MKHRKLQIAWSVGCGIAAALLILLWVRSCHTLDSCQMSAFGKSIHFQSVRGKLVGFYSSAKDGWKSGSFPAFRIAKDSELKSAIMGKANTVTYSADWDRFVVVPYVAALVISLVFGASSWLGWTFSLRTLLIATTLVAVGLGLIVWAAK
jgi:hypothetical protein